jgi:hypothetical protein
MDPDDVAYRRSVRNMVIILVAITIVIFAAIFVPPYVNPRQKPFQASVSYDFPSGFTMHLTLNSTTLAPTAEVLLTGWVNSSSDSIENVTVANSWAFPQGGLWERGCSTGWPIGLGVMKGHYTQDNYTLGALLQLKRPLTGCPASSPPSYFLFYPLSSKALADTRAGPSLWVLQTSLTFGEGSLQPTSSSGSEAPNELLSGVYTAVLADEWGDVLTTNFLVS